MTTSASVVVPRVGALRSPARLRGRPPTCQDPAEQAELRRIADCIRASRAPTVTVYVAHDGRLCTTRDRASIDAKYVIGIYSRVDKRQLLEGWQATRQSLEGQA